jgi:hypothetical protein
MRIPPRLKQRLRHAVLRIYEIALFAAMVIAVGLAGVSTAPAPRLAAAEASPAQCGNIQSSTVVISR